MVKTSKHTLLDSVLFTVLAIPVIFLILRDLIAALLGLLVYNASIPNKRDALLWRAIRCIKVTPYTKSYTNILISKFLIILDTTLFVWFYHCKMPVNA